MTNAGLSGRIGCGKSHIVPMSWFGGTGWFDVGVLASEKPRRGSLRYKLILSVLAAASAFICSAANEGYTEVSVSDNYRTFFNTNYAFTAATPDMTQYPMATVELAPVAGLPDTPTAKFRRLKMTLK